MAYFPHWGQTSVKSTAYNSVSFNPYLYDNIVDPRREKIDHIRLSSDRVESNLLSFFYALRRQDQDYLKEELQLAPIRKTGATLNTFFNTVDKDSVMTALEKETAQKVSAINKQLRIDSSLTDSAWGEERQRIDLEYKVAMFDHYKNNIETVRDAVLGLSRFYIDGDEVSDQLDCLFGQHPNMKEKGWNCYCDISQLDNGLHHLKVQRKLYDDNSDSYRYVMLEIPFIVDRKTN